MGLHGVGNVSENELKVEELKPEDIGGLLERARDTEWWHLLKIREWVRQGSARTDYAEFQTVYGEVDVIKLEEHGIGYPFEIETEYLVIPKTLPVIIRWDHVTDNKQTTIIYIFAKDGWKEVVVQ